MRNYLKILGIWIGLGLCAMAEKLYETSTIQQLCHQSEKLKNWKKTPHFWNGLILWKIGVEYAYVQKI